MSASTFRDCRGFTLVELLVSVVIGAVVLLGVVGLYRGMQASFVHTNSQAVLQRQGSLAVEAIARQARRAAVVESGTALTTCTPSAPAGTTGRVMQIEDRDVNGNATERYCYYAGTGPVASGGNGLTVGAFCERFTNVTAGTTSTCRNLLTEGQGALSRGIGLTGLALLRQPTGLDARCPGHPDNPPVTISVGQNCFAVRLVSPAGAGPADLAFAMTDGLNVMTFSSSLMLRNP